MPEENTLTITDGDKVTKITATVEETTKKWYQSKIVWLAVFTTIVGISDFLYATFSGQVTMRWQDIFLVVSGIVAVILRVWFTDTPIE